MTPEEIIEEYKKLDLRDQIMFETKLKRLFKQSAKERADELTKRRQEVADTLLNMTPGVFHTEWIEKNILKI